MTCNNSAKQEHSQLISHSVVGHVGKTSHPGATECTQCGGVPTPQTEPTPGTQTYEISLNCI